MGLGVYQSEWPRVIEEMVRVLRPGGYLEAVDVDYNLQDSSRALKVFADGLNNALRARDIDPVWADKFRVHFDAVDLEDSGCEMLSFSISHSVGKVTWLGPEWLLRLLSSLRPFLVQVMFISIEEYNELVKKIEQDLTLGDIRINVLCTYGRKPFNDENLPKDSLNSTTV
ncbi:uncharacterized protein VTP21DRAFT_1092 [Calcarisporiella thermophila]|uniref:uncharacterized protein n=1 Tax=Calcarisporiella thermophila TaxID=911321 RepID=UPI00374466D5